MYPPAPKPVSEYIPAPLEVAETGGEPAPLTRTPETGRGAGGAPMTFPYVTVPLMTAPAVGVDVGVFVGVLVGVGDADPAAFTAASTSTRP